MLSVLPNEESSAIVVDFILTDKGQCGLWYDLPHIKYLIYRLYRCIPITDISHPNIGRYRYDTNILKINF